MSIDPEDENAVRSLLDRMADAWARGDARAYADCFTPDSDYVTYNGMHLRGREENAKLHQPLFSGVLKNTQINAPVENLAFLAPDVALVHTAGSTAKRGPSKVGAAKIGPDLCDCQAQRAMAHPLVSKHANPAAECLGYPPSGQTLTGVTEFSDPRAFLPTGDTLAIQFDLA